MRVRMCVCACVCVSVCVCVAKGSQFYSLKGGERGHRGRSHGSTREMNSTYTTKSLYDCTRRKSRTKALAIAARIFTRTGRGMHTVTHSKMAEARAPTSYRCTCKGTVGARGAAVSSSAGEGDNSAAMAEWCAALAIPQPMA